LPEKTTQQLVRTLKFLLRNTHGMYLVHECTLFTATCDAQVLAASLT
jgi:hypothetical protein